jgi:hypothetical protein
VEAIARWRQRHDNTDLFISAARFARPAPDSLYRAGFFLCIGSSPLEEARRQATASVELLFHRLDILPEGVEIVFDGTEGFELAVPLTVFGSPRNAPFMRLWRALARKLAGKGVGGIDLDAYRPDRLLRLPNCRNSETGLYAYSLEFKELRDFSALDICELAVRPTDLESLVSAELSQKATAWFDRAVASLVRAKPPRSGKDRHVPPCVRELEGSRIPGHLLGDAYLVLARFYAAIGMHQEDARAKLEAVGGRQRAGDTDLVARAVQQGWDRPTWPDCRHLLVAMYCEPKTCFRAGGCSPGGGWRSTCEKETGSRDDGRQTAVPPGGLSGRLTARGGVP